MKTRSILILIAAEMAALSLWFVSAAILPDMLAEANISPLRQAALSSGVQIGFVAGALVSAMIGLSDRYDPRHVFACCAVLAGFANAGLLVAEPGGITSICLRFATGALLAGVYPVGMKIAVGWGTEDRGFLVGTLVGALTLGSALPHLVVLSGGSDWRATIAVTSVAAVFAGLLALFSRLGPHHGRAGAFDLSAIQSAWTNRRIRLAYAGYLGHMWELYAMWAWVGLAAGVSYAVTTEPATAQMLASLTAFCAIGAGGAACVIAGRFADRIGKARVAMWAMVASGSTALATAATFGGPVWLTFALFVIWGVFIVPDSAQFSALVADAAPADHAGSLMTLQTALGFALTFFTVQAAPVLAKAIGWPLVLASLAIGPAFGVVAMRRLQHLPQD